MQGEWVRHGSVAAPVVVFIHGIRSSGDSCWRHSNGAYWPDIVAKDHELLDVGVYVYTYRTGIFSGSYRLADVVDDLKERLTIDGVTKYAKIVFVCHSMGGIVARKYLVTRAADLIDLNIQIALFFLASPSLGSDYADWLKPAARLLGHSQAEALRFVRSNDWLADLDREFMNLKEKGRLSIVGKELIEDRFVVFRWIWRKQVVEPFSAGRYFGEAYKVPGSDHSSIAKIESADAFQHRQLKRFIADWCQLQVEASSPFELVGRGHTNNFDELSQGSTTCSHEEVQLHNSNSAVQPAHRLLAVVSEPIVQEPDAYLEMMMGNPTTKHLIDRFWDLDASDRREVALQLALITEEEVALPERQRYDLALVRASERDLLDQLEKLMEERE